jgi:hypothetical protein
MERSGSREGGIQMMPMTRRDAIDGIRSAILGLVDDDHSMCQVAARLGIFCKGFRQFSDEELERKYGWIIKERGPMTREALEDLANRWQLARQLVQNDQLSCDVQCREHDTCLGWDSFSNEQLTEHYKTLIGEEVFIADTEEAQETGRT